MKIHRYITPAILAAGALLLPGLAQAQTTPNFTVAAFATGTQGENSSTDGTGGQYNGDCLQVPYGAGTIWWDGITFDAADGSTGAAYITANFSSGNNTELLVSMAPGYNNWFYEGDSGSCPTGTVNFSLYHAVQFDILWDTNSALTIPQFNTGDGWPLSDFSGPVGSNYMATNSYYTAGVNVDMFTGAGGADVQLGTFQIPTNAGTGWQTVTMPYSDTTAGITSGAGLWFQGANGGYSELVSNFTGAFWIDNVVIVGNTTALPPPTNTLSLARQGLNLFASTGTGLNQREDLETVNPDYSWVGASGPVSYSYTITNYPIATNDQFQTQIFLIPNPGTEPAPDYTEANCIFLDMESTATGGAQVTFRYKTNEPAGNTMIYGSGVLANITSPTAVGTWTLTFDNNTNVTMTTPAGTSTNFNIPDATGATSALFSSGVELYFGVQNNNASAADDHIVVSDFTVTGLGSADFNDNFIADNGIVNASIWETNAQYPPCIQLVGPGNPYWFQWSTPSFGFEPVVTPALSTNISWASPTTHPIVLLAGLETELINTNDLPPGSSAFFALIQRTFSQLLVVLPGQTNAPNTATGLVGTPTPNSLGATGGQEIVTVLAVDAKFNPVPGVTDSIAITTTDPNAPTAPAASLVNGTEQFTDFYFADQGSWTVTATDEASGTTIPPATSSQVTVGP